MEAGILRPQKMGRIVRYALAALCAASAILARWSIENVPPGTAEYVMYYPAVMVAALLGGTSAGLATVFFCAIAESCLFLAPHGFAFVVDDDNVTRLALFLILNTSVSMAIGMHRATAARLQVSERELCAMFEAQAVGIALVRPGDQSFARVNPRLCELTKYPEVDILKMTLQDLLHPAERAAFAGSCAERVTRCTPQFSTDVHILRGDGEVFWAQVSLHVVCDRSAKPLYATAVVQDIDARKRAEEALLEADRRKNEFLAALAHELRNPLATISAGVELLLRSAALKSSPKILSALQRQTRHLARLVDDLMDVSRVSRGKITLKRTVIDLRDSVRSAVALLKELAPEREPHCSVSLPKHPVLVSADSARIEQILTNLLSNAVKYSDPGSAIDVRAAQVDGSAEIRVRDEGIGIPPELQSRIFEAFEQIDVSLDRSKGGVGLGLSLVKRLVEMHGGTVGVSSKGSGNGSEFFVRLPLAEVEEEPREAQLLPPASALQILFAEDKRDTAEFMAAVLEDHGHSVSVVNDGAAAVHAARELLPDVVLLDIGLPILDGFEAARRMRQAGLRESLLIAITGYGQPSDRAASLAAGFDHHLVKPVDYEALSPLFAAWQSSGRRRDLQQHRENRQERPSA